MAIILSTSRLPLGVQDPEGPNFERHKLYNGRGASDPVSVPAGRFQFTAGGSSNNSTLTLEAQRPDGEWFTIDGVDGIVEFDLIPFEAEVNLSACQMRMVYRGGSAPMVDASLSPLTNQEPS